MDNSTIATISNGAIDATSVVRSIVIALFSAEAVRLLVNIFVSHFLDLKKQTAIDTRKTILKKRVRLFEEMFDILEDVTTSAAIGQFENAGTILRNFKRAMKGQIKLYMTKAERSTLNKIGDFLIEASYTNKFNIYDFDNILEKLKACLK